MYLSKTLYLLLDTGSTQEDRKSSQLDLKIVDRGCKASNQINNNRLCLCALSLTLILWHLIWVYNVCKSTLQGFWAYTMLEEMHDPVLSQPIFVKAMSSQVRATSFVIWKIFVYVQMCGHFCYWYNVAQYYLSHSYTAYYGPAEDNAWVVLWTQKRGPVWLFFTIE